MWKGTERMGDYTSLILGGGWGLIVFIGTLIHMRLKTRAMSRRSSSENSSFPKPEHPELLGHR